MRAILTAKQNISYWHPVWEKQYLPHFDKVEVIEIDMTGVAPDMTLWESVTDEYNRRLAKLLQKYELVCVVDIDEILVPDPDKYKDLGDYLDRFKGDYIRATGFDIIEMHDDLPFDLNRSVTDQRHWWYFDELYCKPVLTRKPFEFTRGQHNAKGVHIETDPELLLFHLRDADLEGAEKRRNLNLQSFEERRANVSSIPERWRLI